MRSSEFRLTHPLHARNGQLQFGVEQEADQQLPGSSPDCIYLVFPCMGRDPQSLDLLIPCMQEMDNCILELNEKPIGSCLAQVQIAFVQFFLAWDEILRV